MTNSSPMNPCADAKTMPRRFSFVNGASLPLAIALGTTLCGGALLAGPLQAAPTLGSDENGPQVQILSPSYQDVIKGSFRIAVGITAKNYNPETIEMLVDDRSATDGPMLLSAIGGTSPAAFNWDTRKFTDGPHKLTVRVTDKQGFRGWAEVNIFINNNRAVDTLPPSLIWQNIDNFSSISGRAQIQLEAKDNFGVKMLMVTVNPVDAPARKGALATWLFNRPPYVVNFDSTKVQDGLYTLKANAWDSMDQQGEASQMTIGVINNPINARSIGESLQGLRAFDTAVANPRVNKPAAQLPAGVDLKSQSVVGLEKRVPTLRVETPKVVAPKVEVAKIPAALPAAQTSKPKPFAGALTNQSTAVEAAKIPARIADLTPSAPAFGARPLPQVARVVVKEPVKVAKNEVPAEVEPLAVPQLSGGSTVIEPLATRELSPLESGGENAVREINPRLAKLGVSDLTLREDAGLSNSPIEVDAPSLSRVVELERTARVSALETQIAEDNRAIEGKLSAPLGEARYVEAGQLSAKPVSLNVATAIASEPLTVASPAQEKIEIARLDSPEVATRPLTSEPTLSPNTKQPALAVASDIAIAAQPAAAKAAAVKPSAVAPATTPKVSVGKIAIGKVVRGGLSKVVRKPVNNTAKVEVGKPLMAALPHTEKTTGTSRQAAITVAPIEVTARPMPAVHRVERTTTLRAVAARYGLPVELVAACNVWPVEMNVVKGMTVKLPRPLQVSYNGAVVDSDAPSMMVGDSAVTAFRFMFEKAGGTMSWDAKNQRVVARKGDTEVTLTIGSKMAKVGDEEVMMELAAFLFEGRTMVPIRLFEKGLRAEIEWDPQTGRMVVAMINATAPGMVSNG